MQQRAADRVEDADCGQEHRNPQNRKREHQVRTLERTPALRQAQRGASVRPVFVLTLLAALFVYHINHHWPHSAVLWLRYLGSKLGRAADADDPYILLAGIRAVLVAAATFAYAARPPFPQPVGTYG